MEAEKLPRTVSFPFSAFMMLKSEKGECSAPLYISKLIQAENCVRFRLNPLCLSVKEVCLHHDKSDSDKTVHFAARTSLD